MLKKRLSLFIFLLVITIVFGTLYSAVQHSLRASANDPQIQYAQDFASLLSGGMQAPEGIGTTTPIDIGESLAPYTIVYDAEGKPIGSTGIIEGKIPTPPRGVFAYVRERGEDRITWEPKRGIRSAIVVVPYAGKARGGSSEDCRRGVDFIHSWNCGLRLPVN